MTILGKMMAIFVLVLSILQGALTVMLFVSRSQWSAQNTQLASTAKTAFASAAQFQEEADKMRAAQLEADKASKDKLDKAEKALQIQVALNAGLEKTLSDEKVKTQAAESSVRAIQVDLKLRQADNERMLQVVKERDAQIATLVLENKKEREDRVTAEIQRNAALLAAQKMEEKLRESMKEIVRLGHTGSTTTVGKTNTANPPPETVEGLVSETLDGLVKLTIGSDAGLKEGHTLETYRIAAIPEQSQYLGMVRIKSVTANTAIAEPVGKMSAPMQRGDHVSSRIRGGG